LPFPTELAVNVIDQLIEFGETRRGWLGVRIQPVTDDIGESLGMDRGHGSLVAGIIRGGPVDDGSIEVGDVIIRFDGKTVDSMRDLPRVVAESPVGKAVDVVVIRGGEEVTSRLPSAGSRTASRWRVLKPMATTVRQTCPPPPRSSA
jgi:serine protease Do